MQTKGFLISMGLGLAAGTAMGMMMPRNPAMRQMGREITSAAADTVTKAVNTVEQKMM